MSKRLTLNGVRMGGTSWVVEGGFEENLRALSEDVSDMELILFDTPDCSNIPSESEINRLGGLLTELDMTCTVHFPVDVFATAPLPDRIRSEDICIRTVELFRPLKPFAWIMHIAGELRGPLPSGDMEKWRELAAVSLSRLSDRTGEARNICVETLDYDFSLISDIALKLGFSICLDLGHLVKYGHPVRELAEKYIPYTKVFHVHGVKPDGTDHADLSYFDGELLKDVLSYCTDGMERVMTIEVFEDDYKKSLKALPCLLGGTLKTYS